MLRNGKKISYLQGKIEITTQKDVKVEILSCFHGYPIFLSIFGKLKTFFLRDDPHF